MDIKNENKKVQKYLSSRIKGLLSSSKVHHISILVILFFVLYGFVASSVAPQKYNLAVGDIATSDIPSPKEVVNDYATQKLIDQAVKSVRPVYSIDESVKASALNDVNTFFEKALEIKSIETMERQDKINKLKSEAGIDLADDDYGSAIDSSQDDLKNLESSVKDELIKTLSQEIGNDEEDLKSKKDDFSYSMRNLKFNKELRELGTNIGFALIKPNLLFDSKATDEKVKEAKSSVPPVIVKKGQKIVGKSEVVTEEQMSILKSLGLLEEQNKIDFLLYIGIGILVALFEGLIVAYMYRFSPNTIKSSSRLILIGIIILLEVIFAKVFSAYNISGYLVPVAFASMLFTMLLTPKLAFTINIALSLFVSLMMGYNIDIFVVAIIGGSAGAIASSDTHQRNDLITAGLVVGLANALAILGIGLINSADIVTVLKQSVLGIINGGLSSIFAIGLLPFFESTFDIVTPIKMLELSNPNQPVLRRLLFEAPGTYHHSIIVGNLSEAAVDSIGGTLYHDIGKLKRPYFFKENQITNDNPHNKIAPSLSTLIITNHVKDGVELAKKYKLPTVIIDMINQHHGTTLVKYFYAKAVNDTESHGEVTEMQFRYEGPKPQTREAAVIMLADSVEASVRAIPSPTKVKIEETVKKIVNDKIEDGQLDDCDLTLKDINKIIESFLNVLNGIYHHRIEYPDVVNDKGGDGLDANDRQ